MQKALILFIIFLSPLLSFSQDFSPATLSPAEKAIEKNSLDSFSNAVVLNEYGHSFMEVDEAEGRLYVHTLYHVKIKIFNNEGYDNANIVIPINNNSEVKNIQGYTIGNADNSYRITELSPKNIYSEQTTKDLKLVKFTLPDLQPGCIIEYSYELITPNIFNFKTWHFQAGIPKLHSLFNPVIPSNFKYNISLRGYLPLATNASRLLKEKFQYNNLRYDCSDLYFAMDSVPAFVEEDFMTSANNFMAAVYFELSEQVLKSGNSEYYTKSWKHEEELLRRHKDFGLQLKNDRILKKSLPLILPADTAALARAKAITAYIKKQIKWNKQFDIFTTGNISDALEKHSGNTADINFNLITALNLAGIPTDIAILSTRDNIVPNKLYPVITNFNDVVALAHINGKEYWLDATDPDLGFGQLPLQCLNDSARIIPRDGPSYWKLIAPNQLLKETYAFKGKLNPNGRLEGYLTIKSDSYTAAIKRKMIAACNSVDEYADKKADANPGITWNDYTITGTDSSDDPVIESYHITTQLFNPGSNSKELFFNPFLFNKTQSNPFNLDRRFFPIDFGMKKYTVTSVSIELPENWTIQQKPENTHFVTPGKSAEFAFNITLKQNILECNYNERINRIQLPPEEYFNLKELFSKIVQTEKKDIIFDIR